MIEKKLRDKIEELIARAPGIANVTVMERTIDWEADGEAWVTEAVNAVELAVPDAFNAYRKRMVELAPIVKAFGTPLPERIPRIASLLRFQASDQCPLSGVKQTSK